MEIPFVEELPDEAGLKSLYSLVVDALFGFSFVGPPRPQFALILDTLKVCRQSFSISNGRTNGRTGHALFHDFFHDKIQRIQVLGFPF